MLYYLLDRLRTYLIKPFLTLNWSRLHDDPVSIQRYLELSRRLGCIRDHIYVVMSSGVIAQGSPEWVHLKEVLREVHGGRVYRCRLNVEGGRGGRGMG